MLTKNREDPWPRACLLQIGSCSTPTLWGITRGWGLHIRVSDMCRELEWLVSCCAENGTKDEHFLNYYVLAVSHHVGCNCYVFLW